MTLNMLAHAIRALSMDAVQQANSGHPGMPMGMADIATVLWKHHINHAPQSPLWHNRDRFVLSNGHGSMLLYALLHLTGYDVSIEDLKAFRTLNSKTPGHPEFGHTPGVETTTGPLGQGLATAVGMAIAEKQLATSFNKPNYPIIDHHTYVFVGDGCLMEGISHEACSLAGTLSLGKLIVFYDDNGISIDGPVSPWFSDDTQKRFEAYHWHVIPSVDGHNHKAIDDAIRQAKSETDKPTLIICKTKIGYGSPNLEGLAKSHGSPLGNIEIEKTKQVLGFNHPPFEIPDEIKQGWCAINEGKHRKTSWDALFASYQETYPEIAQKLTEQLSGQLDDNLNQHLLTSISPLLAEQKSLATRKSSEICLNAFAHLIPGLLGGSADLSGSNNTKWQEARPITTSDFTGNYLHYGVREFAMSAIANGMAAHGGLIPFVGTFLVFSDYAKNAIRLSALMNVKVIYVLTHDSIGLGEDGPTHQPIEQLAMLRLTPNLKVWRPACLLETAVAWSNALTDDGPSCLILSRQALTALHTTTKHASKIQQGAYILEDSESPEILLLATGSEVMLAQKAHHILNKSGIATRVVSMPCIETFENLPAEIRNTIIPPSIKKRIAIEASSSDYWHKFTGLDGKIVGLNSFGQSAPAEVLFNTFSITVDTIVSHAKNMALGVQHDS